ASAPIVWRSTCARRTTFEQGYSPAMPSTHGSWAVLGTAASARAARGRIRRRRRGVMASGAGSGISAYEGDALRLGERRPSGSDDVGPCRQPSAVERDFALLAGRERALEERGHAPAEQVVDLDRKSTRLNSSHVKISYAVF